MFPILTPPPSSLPIPSHWVVAPAPSIQLKCDVKRLLFFNLYFILNWASLVAQRLKRLPAMRETWVLSLGQEVPLEKEMATHSSILA